MAPLKPPFDSIYSNLQILHLSDPVDLKELEDLLTSKSREAIGVLNNSPAQAILQHIQNLNCKSVILEKNYVSKDFLEGYGEFYSKRFKPYESRCTRIHFFGCEVIEEDLVDLVSKKKEYLGYVTMHPTPAFNIGKTVLLPLIADSNSDFVVGKIPSAVNLSGSSLQVIGVPFMQQDQQVGACATACLWIALQCLSEKFGTRDLSPAEITRCATRYDVTPGRAIPSPGLTSGQICQAIREAGFEPEVFDCISSRSRSETKALIYRYIESELPVILGIINLHSGVRHAIVAIGHSYASNPTPHRLPVPGSPGREYISTAEWIGETLYVNDDRLGPYRKLTIWSDSRVATLGQSNPYPQGMFVTIEGDPSPWLIQTAIVPVPREVSLKGDVAEQLAVSNLLLFDQIVDTVPALKALNIPPFTATPPVLRVHLIKSNDFKIAHGQRGDIPSLTKQIFRGMPLPKYIWHVGITEIGLMNQSNVGERKYQAEMLLDATELPYASPLLGLYHPKFLIRRGEAHNKTIADMMVKDLFPLDVATSPAAPFCCLPRRGALLTAV